MEATYSKKEYEFKEGVIIAVYRPELTEEEREKNERKLKIALNCFGQEMVKGKKKNGN